MAEIECPYTHTTVVVMVDVKMAKATLKIKKNILISKKMKSDNTFHKLSSTYYGFGNIEKSTNWNLFWF